MATIRNYVLIVFQIFWITLFKHLAVILTSRRRKGEEKIALLNSNILFFVPLFFFSKKSNLPVYFLHLCKTFSFFVPLVFWKSWVEISDKKNEKKSVTGSTAGVHVWACPQPLHVKQTQKTRATYLSPFFAEKDGTNLHVVEKNGRMDTFIEQKRRYWSVKSRRRPHI